MIRKFLQRSINPAEAVEFITFFFGSYARNLIVANMPALPTTKPLCYAFGNRVCFIPGKGRKINDDCVNGSDMTPRDRGTEKFLLWAIRPT
jgi:hypothetical protein